MTKYSPWGRIHYQTIFEIGVQRVNTGTHGGFMIDKKYAEEFLSEAARSRGMDYGRFLCYEEDCDWTIPAFELEHLHEKIFASFNYKGNLAPKEFLLRSLSAWSRAYLVERNIEPTPGVEDEVAAMNARLN